MAEPTIIVLWESQGATQERPERAERPERPERPEQPERIEGVPQPPSPDAQVLTGQEQVSPGRITIMRDGKVITLDGAPGPGAIFAGSGQPDHPFDLPPNIYSLAQGGIVGFTLMVIAFPVFGFAKALVNRRAATQAALPSRDTTDRLQRIEAAVEAMSVEVERISEGQRFVTRVLAERSSAQT